MKITIVAVLIGFFLIISIYAQTEGEGEMEEVNWNNPQQVEALPAEDLLASIHSDPQLLGNPVVLINFESRM